MRSPDEISLVSAHRRDGRSGGQGYRSSRVICKSFPESLGFESMKGHEKQPRRGLVWQGQSHPEERPGEATGEGAASVRVDTETGDARTMRFLRMLMTDVEWACLSR